MSPGEIFPDVAPRAAPPVHVGGWQRLRRDFFSTPLSGLLTLLLLCLLAWLGWQIFAWAVPNAVFTADAVACRALDLQHACWGFIHEKHRVILFGRYPYEEQWRPTLALLLAVAAVIYTANPRCWNRSLLLLWPLSMFAFFALLGGGLWGLSTVESVRWGGLPLTLLLTMVSVVASIPLGVLLALGRQSQKPVLSIFCSTYIELVRGVPLITVLFLASFILPLLFPQGPRVDALSRIMIGMTLFQAAYLAETVRGGLQGIAHGQYEAAYSIGLGYWRTRFHVILPQAVVLVIPAFVNNLLSMFLDTSLVMVVSMYDLVGALRLALGDPQWRNFFIEGYVFITLIYFGVCMILSRYSRWLERRLQSNEN